jgi:hypothetical protein
VYLSARQRRGTWNCFGSSERSMWLQVRQAQPILLYDFRLVGRESSGPFPRRAHTDTIGGPQVGHLGRTTIAMTRAGGGVFSSLVYRRMIEKGNPLAVG